MAAAKKFDWGDGNGKIHTISKADYDAQQAAKRRVADPPAGTYDPNLDAQQNAETRSWENTTDDVRTRGLDLGVDLGIARDTYDINKGRLGEDYDTSKAATERSYGRSLSDLLQTRGRSGEDYGNTLTNLQRNYDTLANTQGEQTRKAGAEATGGAFAQSARKRAANQALDKAPIDLAYNRFMQDSTTSEGRLGEDKQTSLAGLLTNFNRGGQDLDRGMGQTDLNYSRATRDNTLTGTRADDAHTGFGLDINNAKQFSWGGQAITGAGTPVNPKPVGGSSPTSSPAPTSIGAGPGYPKSKKRKGKGGVVTYSNSVSGP